MPSIILSESNLVLLQSSTALIQRVATPAHLCWCPRRYGEMRVVPLRNHSPSDNEVRRAKKLGCPVIKVGGPVVWESV